MADITSVQDYLIVQPTTPSNPVWKLANKINATQTSIVVNFEPKDEDGASITKDFLIGIETEGYVETMLCTNVSGTTLTVVRGIDLGGLDFSGSASNATSHPGGSKVFTNVSAPLLNMLLQAIRGSIGTGGTHLLIGLGTDVNLGIKAQNADANKPFVEYDSTTNQWVASNDGTSSFVIGTGAGAITGGDGITVTAGDIDIDTTDTVIFVETSAGAGDSGKVVILDASGLIKQLNIEGWKDVAATSTEINQALDGISVNVTDTNLNTLTGGGDASSLHSHDSWDFISSDLGVATGATSTIPAGATKAIINVTANSGNSATYGGISKGQITIFASGLTSATFQEVGNVSNVSGVTCTWSSPNITVTQIGVAGSVDIYYFK